MSSGSDPEHRMIYSAQLRAARALLGWRQEDLAREARVGLATIQRIEQADGPAPGHGRTLWKLQAALERSGVQFIGGAPDDPTFGVTRRVV
jgi:transcriptional regulator with XRE-family HTH domain